jgi:hypothetical protein
MPLRMSSMRSYDWLKPYGLGWRECVGSDVDLAGVGAGGARAGGSG